MLEVDRVAALTSEQRAATLATLAIATLAIGHGMPFTDDANPPPSTWPALTLAQLERETGAAIDRAWRAQEQLTKRA